MLPEELPGPDPEFRTVPQVRGPRAVIKDQWNRIWSYTKERYCLATMWHIAQSYVSALEESDILYRNQPLSFCSILEDLESVTFNYRLPCSDVTC